MAVLKPGQISIGRDAAIELAESRHWEGMSQRERALFQMHTVELTMPFDVFHQAVEFALGRPVWTHEFGLNWAGLARELNGDAAPPTMQEILNLIPAEKRIVVILPKEGGQ